MSTMERIRLKSKITPRDVEEAARLKDAAVLKAIAIRTLESNLYHVSALLSINTMIVDDQVPTACIHLMKRECRISSKFILEHACTPDKLAAILCHEIYHHLLRHIAIKVTDECPLEARDIALDATINALLCSVFKSSKFRAWFTGFYPATEFPANILRPRSKMFRYSDKKRYATLYMRRSARGGAWGLSFQDIIDWIMEQNPEMRSESRGGHRVVIIGPGAGSELIGSHEKADEVLSEETVDMLQGVAREAQRILGEANKTAGFAKELFDQVIENLEAKRNSQMVEAFTKALQQSGISKTMHAIRSRFPELNDRSVVPLGISRQNIAQLAQGFIPVFWQTKIPDVNSGTVHVYIDTSGSMGDWIKWAYELCVALSTWLAEPIHLFSNAIADISIKELQTGIVHSTGGTDFDCIIEHAIKSKYDKVVIVTDGYANMSEENQAAIISTGMKVFTAIIPGCDRDSVLVHISAWSCFLREEDKID